MLSQIFKSSVVYLLVLIILICWVLSSQAQHQSTCSRHTCKPPKCRCPGHSIPGGLRHADTPQMVLLTFDDAVNWDNWDFYTRLFPPDGRRKNPNGCPQAATFFVSHNYTDYCMVRKLHARGMEIGDHSVTHKLPRKWWTEADVHEIGQEVLNQRSNIAQRAHIPEWEIRGWRSPFLQPAGDDLFTVLNDNNFTYDASLTYSFPKNLFSPVLWPFTLDFGYPLVCNIARCPSKPYPGFWIVPVVVVMDYREQKACAYLDHCDNMPQNTHEAFQFLWKNFLRNYRSNRAPLYLNLHSPWFSKNADYLEAMDQFLEKLSQMNDVYVIPVHKSLEWQLNPTPLDKIQDFKPWSCPNYEPNQEDRKICTFTFRPKSGKVEKRHEESNNSENRKKHLYEKIVKTSNTQTHKPVRSQTHFEPSDEDTDNNGVIHHHNHRTHKPWFLRNSATPSKISLFIIFGISAVHCFMFCRT